MHLIYTEDCDPSYEPLGFVPGQSPLSWDAQYEGWHMRTNDCGEVDTRYHA
jgi:hypothetical protein